MARGPFGLECNDMGRHYHWVSMDGDGPGFPLVEIAGKKTGPTLFVTAGLHGSEYTGIDALMRFSLILDPERLEGRVIALPLVNLPAFQQRTATVCPVDGKNLNRIFPGSPTGSYSERLAYCLAQEIEAQADYVLDLHGNDLGEAVLPLAAVHLTGEGVDETTSGMAAAYGLPYQVHSHPGEPWGSGGTLFAWAAQEGIPAILVQSGGQGQFGEEDVARHLWGLINLTRFLGMQREEVERRRAPEVFTDLNWVKAERDGIYRSWVDAGEKVTRGQILGTFYDYFGRELKKELSPAPGTVLYAAMAPSMRSNRVLAAIGTNSQ